MTTQRIAEVFKTVAKLVYINQIGTTIGDEVKAAVVALEAQNASAENAADPYAELQNFVGPALNSVRPVVQGLDRLPMIARGGIDSYLRIIAPELNQDATATPAAILSTLGTRMTATSNSVAPSGMLYRYALAEYGVQLPQHSPPTFLENWVTVSIV